LKRSKIKRRGIIKRGIIKTILFFIKIDAASEINNKIERVTLMKGKKPVSKTAIKGTDLSMENQRLKVYSIATNKNKFVIVK
jgi:hypothetical protein